MHMHMFFQYHGSVIAVRGLIDQLAYLHSGFFFLQGHDTTAMSSNWATHLIGTDPDVQRKVHEELDSIFGN